MLAIRVHTCVCQLNLDREISQSAMKCHILHTCVWLDFWQWTKKDGQDAIQWTQNIPGLGQLATVQNSSHHISWALHWTWGAGYQPLPPDATMLDSIVKLHWRCHVADMITLGCVLIIPRKTLQRGRAQVLTYWLWLLVSHIRSISLSVLCDL